MRRRLIAICGGSSACFSGVLEIMECCWGCQLACCHEASLCHQTVSGKPAHGIIAHIPNKNHLVFLHYESWRAADFLSKAQTSRVSPDWLWWGHGWVSLRRVADSRMGSVYLRLFSFLQSFWLAHMNTHPMTYSRDCGLRIPDLLIFHTLVSLQFLEDRWWFLMLPFCSLATLSSRQKWNPLLSWSKNWTLRLPTDCFQSRLTLWMAMLCRAEEQKPQTCRMLVIALRLTCFGMLYNKEILLHFIQLIIISLKMEIRTGATHQSYIIIHNVYLQTHGL